MSENKHTPKGSYEPGYRKSLRRNKIMSENKKETSSALCEKCGCWPDSKSRPCLCNKTETPRCDALEFADVSQVRILARRLEREIAELRKEKERLQKLEALLRETWKHHDKAYDEFDAKGCDEQAEYHGYCRSVIADILIAMKGES